MSFISELRSRKNISFSLEKNNFLRLIEKYHVLCIPTASFSKDLYKDMTPHQKSGKISKVENF